MPGYEIPPRQKPKEDKEYLEQMTKAIFRAGFSWKVVNSKWPNFQSAFDGFDIDKVAAYSEIDLDRLLANEGIVRNGRKIAATIENANELQNLIRTYGSVHDYLRSMDEWAYAERRKELTKRFKGLGPTGVFVFLWCVAEEVPDWEDRNK
jgi:3-methyladenine DNA glycosylase Tag